MKNIIKLKLREIERTLELTREEGGPFSKKRERMNTQRRKLLTMLEGRDPRYSITGKINYNGGLTAEQREMVRIKRTLQEILSILH